MKKTEVQPDLIANMTMTTAVVVRPNQLKLKRKLTMDATSIARLAQVVCRVEGEMEVIEMPPAAKGAPPSEAHAVPILDLVRNEQFLLICNSLIVSAFRRAGEPLTGRYFALRAGDIAVGKRYRHVDVMELEVAE
jgi:hypothetical protein